ncbi:MAG: phosphate signaling complex protein PhoU [Lachnospiraceae bacterium]
MTRNKFDMQLENLNKQLIHMGELCEVAIGNAAKALKDGDLQLAKAIMGEDEEIDQMEKDVERLCLKLLLQLQPVARDLRQISAALKMITDMERIGDQTSDIADIIIASGMKGFKDIAAIGEMAEATSKMVRDSVTAYVNKDLELAQQVIEADDQVDHLFDAIKNKLVDLIAIEKGNDGQMAIDLIMISKYLERIGDHATNIAEWVEFSITGVHQGSENIF